MSRQKQYCHVCNVEHGDGCAWWAIALGIAIIATVLVVGIGLVVL